MTPPKTFAPPRLVVGNPSDLVDRWIVTDEDGHPVISFVSAAARHYLRAGETVSEVAVTNTDTALLWMEPTPGLFTREGRRPVVVPTADGVQLANEQQVDRWIDNAKAADDYDVRSGFRRPLAYLLSAAISAVAVAATVTFAGDRWAAVVVGTVAFVVGMLGAAGYLSLRRRYLGNSFDTDAARWARARQAQLALTNVAPKVTTRR